MNIQFRNYSCTVVLTKYAKGGANALALVLAEDDPSVKKGDAFPGEPVMNASTNVAPALKLADDEIAIKDYSENEGILDVLIKAKIVSPPIGFAASGFVQIPICKLLMPRPVVH